LGKEVHLLQEVEVHQEEEDHHLEVGDSLHQVLLNLVDLDKEEVGCLLKVQMEEIQEHRQWQTVMWYQLLDKRHNKVFAKLLDKEGHQEAELFDS